VIVALILLFRVGTKEHRNSGYRICISQFTISLSTNYHQEGFNSTFLIEQMGKMLAMYKSSGGDQIPEIIGLGDFHGAVSTIAAFLDCTAEELCEELNKHGCDIKNYKYSDLYIKDKKVGSIVWVYSNYTINIGQFSVCYGGDKYFEIQKGGERLALHYGITKFGDVQKVVGTIAASINCTAEELYEEFNKHGCDIKKM